MKTCIYLRKSRADEEVERKFGEGETLKKHRAMLLKYAKENNLTILKIREEIVSGESLIHRPEMLELLKEVEQNLYEAVLCVDIERLGRGNMQEQGLILETFKKSNTKIITLRKIYDLQDDFDEEYSEFEAFMSRKELKLINRRLQRGRIHSIHEGNYIGTLPPYGYLKKDLTLIEHPEQNHVVKLIFDLYLQGIGTGTIANRLNDMGYKSYTGKNWERTAVTNILSNCVYTGKLAWRKKEIKKSINPYKKKDVRTRSKDEWIITQGRHPAIIDDDTFNRAQEIKSSHVIIPHKTESGVINTLAGIIKCKVCGATMLYRPYQKQKAHMICPKKCGNKSCRFEYIESKLINALEIWLKSYEIEIKNTQNNSIEIYKSSIKALENELNTLNKQKSSLYDLLEQGVYDINTFLERSNTLSEKIIKINNNLSVLRSKIETEQNENSLEAYSKKIKSVLESYKTLPIGIERNHLLKSIIEKAEYYKEKSQVGDNFSLYLHPKFKKNVDTSQY